MKIKDVIKLLETMDLDAELELYIDDDGVHTGNEVLIDCDYCEGSGVATYETSSDVGFQSNGDYKEPDIYEYEDTCHRCEGSGKLSCDAFVLHFAEDLMIADRSHLKIQGNKKK